MMNKKWTALALGLVITLSSGTYIAAHPNVSQTNENVRTPIIQVQDQRALETSNAEWQSLQADFEKVAALESSGQLEKAQELWEELIPKVDEKLGIYFDLSNNEDMDYDETYEEDSALSSEGWMGYINTFSDLIDDSEKLSQLMDFAADLDSLDETSPMVAMLEKQLSVLLTDALGDIDLAEVGSVFADPVELEDTLSEADLEQYGKLLDLYVNDEISGDFEAAQDKYDQIIDLLNAYPEVTMEAENELYAQYQVKNEMLTEVKAPKDEMGSPLELAESTAEDKKHFRLLWDYVLKLMPDSATDYVDTFEVGSDGKDGTLAYVYPTNETGKKFVLNLDYKDMVSESGVFNKVDLDETIVHEFGHIITLNHTQLTGVSNGTYETQEGILTENSYMNKFYAEFWKGKTEKYLLSNEDGYRQYDVEKLYTDHEAWFVSDYAATNVEEDIAESFRVFVLEDKASGNGIKDQKVNFFYQFPELVTMRDEIRDGK